MCKIYSLLIGLALSCTAYSQGNQLKGKVLDAATRKPLSGAVIRVSGKVAAVSAADGSFSIDCKDSMDLLITSLNYESMGQKVRSCSDELSITLLPSSHILNEVEISTSNPNKKELYQAVSVSRIAETELKRSTGLFLDDAINSNMPGVFMERRTVSAGQQFNIRGYGNGARGTNGINSNFDGQGYKVYLNGIPITDAEGITLMDDIDFASIGNVDVIKGPAGTLYGLAIAGVVNLKSIKPEPGRISVGQDVLIGSYGLQRYTTNLRIGGERSSFLVNYGKQYYDGFMPHTASHKDFVNLVGEFRPNAKQSISTYFGYSNSYDERNGELTKLQYDTLNYSGNPNYINNDAHSNVISFRGGISHIWQLAKWLSNSSTLFGSGISSNVSSAGGWTDKTPLNYGMRSVFDMKFALNERFSLNGVAGVELQKQHAQTIGYTMVKDSFNLQGYNIIGPMRSNQYTISKTSSIFTEWTLAMPSEFFLTAGVGLSTMDIELNDRMYVPSNNNPSNPNGTHNPTRFEASYKGMLSPHVALNKVFKRSISAYVSYSTGYKAPVSSYFFIPLTGQVNKDLKPEMGTQFEIGSKGSLFKDRLSYQLAVFNAIFSNKMTVVAVPNASNTATSYTYVANGGRQNNKGVELSLKYLAYQSNNTWIKSVSPFVNFTYSDFKYEDFRFQQLSTDKKSAVITDFSGNTVAGVPPVTFNAGLDLLSRSGLYGNVTYNYRDAMYFTSDEKNKTEAYGVLNAKLGFRHNIAKRFELDLYAGAVNITNTQYYQMVFLNQLPDAYLPAPNKINYFGGLNLRYFIN